MFFFCIFSTHYIKFYNLPLIMITMIILWLAVGGSVVAVGLELELAIVNHFYKEL